LNINLGFHVKNFNMEKVLKCLLIIVPLIIVAACKKDEPAKVTDPSNRELLVNTWKYYGNFDDADTNGIPDHSVYYPPAECDEEDELTFRSNGTYFVSAGGPLCNDSAYGAWRFGATDTNLIFVEFGINYNMKIVELTSHSLKFLDPSYGVIKLYER
jgi:hypothetical protein